MATQKYWNGSQWVDVTIGFNGPTGATGQGLITGGNAGQLLRKKTTGTDYDTEWINFDGSYLVATSVPTGALAANSVTIDKIGDTFMTRLTSASTTTSTTMVNIFPSGSGTLALSSNATYMFKGYIPSTLIKNVVSATLGITLTFSQTPTSYLINTLGNYFGTTANANARSTTPGATLVITTANATNGTGSCYVEGYFITGSSGGTVTPQFLSSAAGTTSMTIDIGAYFTFTRVGSLTTPYGSTGWS
jgi:hypothetical protein